MANNKKIFIDFYSKQKNDTFSIDDAVRDSYEGNKFRNDRFCPECRQAQWQKHQSIVHI